jgi:hypothetical protein
MPINVFLSVGRPFTKLQEDFITNVENYIKNKGLRPRTVGRTVFSNQQPLKLVNETMSRSGGALIIALERLEIKDGSERGGPPSGSTISNEHLCTPWNQIEAAFAYSKGLPLLVVRQDTVRAEGLLEARYDWYVHSTKLDVSFLSTLEFEGTFESWRRDVFKRAGWFRYRK